MDYQILEDSLSYFEDKINVCFYHSFYLGLKNIYSDIFDFKLLLEFKETNDYFTSIGKFLLEYPKLYHHLIKHDSKLKNILNNLVLGIFELENNKAKIVSYIKLYNLNKNDLSSIFCFENNLKNEDKIINIINYQEHFDPIIFS